MRCFELIDNAPCEFAELVCPCLGKGGCRYFASFMFAAGDTFFALMFCAFSVPCEQSTRAGAWPSAAEVMELIGQGEGSQTVQPAQPGSPAKRGRESGQGDQAAQVGISKPHYLPHLQRHAEEHLGRLVGNLLQAGEDAGPVELITRAH